MPKKRARKPEFKRRIYLDYAATTPVDPEVFLAMAPYFTNTFGNPGSMHIFGQSASGAVFEARRIIADALQATPEEIFFTGSATEANNLFLRGVCAGKKGKNIIISAVEHESIYETANDLESEGIEIRKIPVSPEGVINLSYLKTAIDENTLLISVMYANNEIGTIEPMAQIAEIIRNFKSGKLSNLNLGVDYPLLHTDAVQALQYLSLSVKSLHVDAITLSAHKIYGPKGIGALYIRDKGRATGNKQQAIRRKRSMSPAAVYLLPIITGGGQELGMRSGTENVPAIVGFGRAVQLLYESQEKETKRMYALRDYFWNQLKKQNPKLQLNGVSLKKNIRLPNNLNIRFPERSAQELLIALDLHGVSASSGPACGARSTMPSKTLLEIGLSEKEAKESIRFMLGKFTTRHDIDTALRVIKNNIKTP